MSRLIDADAYARDMHELNERVYRWYLCAKDEDVRKRANGAISVLAEVRFMLDRQQTIDAIPVVRCEDCSRRCICYHSADYYCADGEKVTE